MIETDHALPPALAADSASRLRAESGDQIHPLGAKYVGLPCIHGAKELNTVLISE